jgi:hypothetical protein
MKVLTLAAGVAVGYVLGTRAGREKYEQIAEGARKLSAHPTVVQAQDKAKELIGNGTDAVTAKIASARPDAGSSDTPGTSATPATSAPRAGRGKPAADTVEVVEVVDVVPTPTTTLP